MTGYTKPPKVILRFDLSEDKTIKIVLVLLQKHFIDTYTEKNIFISKNGFSICRGTKLYLFKGNAMTLPSNFPSTNLQSDSVVFDSEEDRYKYMITMKNALLEWSKSEFWKGYNDSDKPRISFTNKVWIIF